jgi:predicted Zn-dependent protease
VALQLGEVKYANEIAGLFGAGVEFGLLLPYSRGQELEADRLGVVTMERAGFDPCEAPELWRRMDRQVPDRGPTFLATHPAPTERIAALEKQVAGRCRSR